MNDGNLQVSFVRITLLIERLPYMYSRHTRTPRLLCKKALLGKVWDRNGNLTLADVLAHPIQTHAFDWISSLKQKRHYLPRSFVL